MENKTSSLLNGELNSGEYGKFYAVYIQQSSGRDLFDLFRDGRENVNRLIDALDESSASYRYAPDKWTIREIIGHLTDTERIMAYRALAISRGEQIGLPGYDHNQYVNEANFEELTLQQFRTDYNHVRSSTESLFRSFSDEMLLRSGTASGSPFSVRALGYIIAGHELHHLKVLKERYFGGIALN